MSIYQENNNVNLTDCIGPAFYDVFWDIREEKHTYYELDGGRGSLKSSFISISIVLGIVEDPDANAIIYRKVRDTIGDSVYEQIVWAIDKLKLSHLFHCTVSPFRCTYLPTGQKILFKGLDKAKKQKSSKVSRGYFKYLWFEELDEYAGPEEIRSVQQSILRGGSKYVVFKSYNAPRSLSSWVNVEKQKNQGKKDTLFHHSTYLTSPPEWLGQQFIDDAEYLKKINEKAYRHEYLGEPVGDGTNVFDNIVGRTITDEEIKTFEYIYMGIDWGWYPDPFHWGKMSYDSNKRILYIYDELRVTKTSNEGTWNMLKIEKGVTEEDLITADSAEPKSVSDYRMYGSNCHGAKKGPESVRQGIKWLQSLVAIVIDPIRCPATYQEFSQYELEKTPDGQPISAFPDADNHSIDMVRYAMERVWQRRGA